MLFKNFCKKNFCLLKDKLKILIPNKQREVNELLKIKRNMTFGKKYTLKNVYDGMDNMKPLFYETSRLSKFEGILFRGKRLADVIEKLRFNKESPLPESLIWLFLTGELPNEAETKSVIESISRRSTLPERLIDM